MLTDTDGHARYGNAYRRAAIRTSCQSLDGVVVVSLTITEHDPTNCCTRRVKGQAACTELQCDQCHSDGLNLVSVSSDAALGAIAHALTKKLKQFDRQHNLARNHGIVEPSDIEWDEHDLFPTGW